MLIVQFCRSLLSNRFNISQAISIYDMHAHTCIKGCKLLSLSAQPYGLITIAKSINSNANVFKLKNIPDTII